MPYLPPVTDDIILVAGGVEMLDSVKGMWSKLTRDASVHSTHFSRYFREKSWEERKEEFLKKAGLGRLNVDIATHAGKELGFCISTVIDGAGEVESLFVEECSRGRKVGEMLMQRSIRWMKDNGARTMAVFTVYGNEDVLAFYAKQGFHPISIMLIH
ncbi:MAG TPA: GNAT family N-acetyltransferase, partial [Methanomassiliicoccaceae archaeon]|nr:GNAT family N-acetyltransferase [Methanomassiliicoccaceae archaeon]